MFCGGVSQDGQRIDNFHHADPDFIAVALEITRETRSPFKQSPPIPAEISQKLRTIIPAPQSTRIVGRFIAGESVRSIARAENRDRATVAKIVRGPEVHQYIGELRARFVGATEIAMETLLEELRNPDSRTRGWLAFEMLRAGSVIPNRNQTMELESRTPEPEPESEQAAIKRIAVALVQGAIERHRFFGIPLPEADEVEQSLLAKAKENGGRCG
jgi:hypothetical protein